MTTLLAVDRLSKRFGGVQAVAELSFDVAEKEILGIIGPNGAGKTTAVNLVSGVTHPSGGTVRLSGKEVTGLAPHVLVESGLVRTFQATTVYAASTVRENLLRGAYRQIYAGLLPALLGTVFMVTLPELLRGYVNVQQILFGAILFATMAFIPGGLIEVLRRIRGSLPGARPKEADVADAVRGL